MAIRVGCRLWVASLFVASALRRGVKKQDCFSLFDGMPLLELTAESPDELSGLRTELEELGCTDVGDVKGLQVTLICSTEQTATLQSSYGQRVKVLEEDAGDFYRTTSGVPEEFVPDGRNLSSTVFYTAWRTTEARIAQVQAAVTNSGGVATIYQAGSSVEGRPIMAVRMRGAGWSSGSPRVVVDCALHAREWITAMACVYAVEAAIEKAMADPSWLANTELAFVPDSNPDGTIYSETTNRMWRKNLAVNSGSTCRGVDLNRNWEPDWSGPGATSSNPCSDVYYGPSAFSEPETLAVKAVIDEAPVTVHLDVHSYSNLILVPWSYTRTPHPRRAEMDVLGLAMQAAIEARHGVLYRYGAGPEILYPASGVCEDYGTSQGAFGYTYELRPANGAGGGFAPPADQILPTAEETWEGILVAISFAQNPPAPPAPTPAPPPGSWVISGDGCEMDGNCIQSLNYPSNYGNNQACTVELAGSVSVTVEAFRTESRYDILTVGGQGYSGTSGPSNGTYSGYIIWASDYSVTTTGWRLCRA